MRINLFRAVAVAVLMTLAAGPALAQSVVRGKALDAQGKPVPDATVLFERQDVNQKAQTKTDRNGDFLQVGLASGEWKITISKDKVGTASQTARVSQGNNNPLSFTLAPAAAPGGGIASADKAEAAALQALAGTALDAMRAGRHDEAIAKFNEAIGMLPNCHVCYYYIGLAHAQKQRYPDSEAAYKKAIEVKPDFAEAYNALAGVYNSQKKYDEAIAMSTKAAEVAGSGGGGGNAAAIYNQGVSLWNAQKFAEAKAQFEKAVALDPNMAEAWYQLGMANLNTGDMNGAVAAFEGYLKAAPNGPKAAEAKTIISQLKK
jgi:tetratricopeptide (TPR) repeat protein